METGSASIVINRSPGDVFSAITDVSRIGEWSPECTGARWVPPSTEAAVGASFEGDNIAKLGPITLKRWTTTSEVTELVPNEVFGFVAAGYTNWRYELAVADGGTTVTESYSYAPYTGMQRFLYNTLGRRRAGMAKGVAATLARMKAVLEAS